MPDISKEATEIPYNPDYWWEKSSSFGLWIDNLIVELKTKAHSNNPDYNEGIIDAIMIVREHAPYFDITY